jgi:hypothetical protein
MIRKRIIGFAAIVVILAAIFTLVLVRPNLFQNGSSNPPNNPQFSGPVGAGASGNAGPQPAVTYGPPISGVTTGVDAKHAVSPALRDIPIPLATPPTTITESGRPESDAGDDSIPRPVLPQITDPVRQVGFGPSLFQPQALTPLLNFAGVNNRNGVYPPDTTGDVGPNNYVQYVNLSYQVYNKSGVPQLASPISGNLLWTNLGAPCATRNDGDVQVLYDSIADRWVLAQFTAVNPYGECMAVSTTSDPTGSYYLYFFQFSTTVFYDYPKLGLWPDGYYLTDNRFTTTFQGASAIALNRTAMLAGGAAAYLEFQTSTSYGVLMPASLDGSTTPPAGEPEFIAEIGTSALHLWKFHVDWTTPGNSTFTGPASMPVAAYNQLCASTRSCIPQPGTTAGLDGIGDRLM